MYTDRPALFGGISKIISVNHKGDQIEGDQAIRSQICFPCYNGNRILAVKIIRNMSKRHIGMFFVFTKLL